MTASKQLNQRDKPTEIRRLLASVFEHKNWRSKLELHRVFEFWDNTVGKDIAGVAQPVFIRGHVLWVKVADSVWMQQLHLQKIMLLQKINQQLHGEQISDIHFQLNSAIALPPEPETTKSTSTLPAVDREQEKEFDRLISSLANKDLRASLKSLWLKMHKKATKD